jgi:putative heme iron utilization protein
MKVTEAQGRIINKGGRRALGLKAMKVRVSKGSVSVTVPKDFCRMVSAEVGDKVLFGLAPWSEVISMCVIQNRR